MTVFSTTALQARLATLEKDFVHARKMWAMYYGVTPEKGLFGEPINESLVSAYKHSRDFWWTKMEALGADILRTRALVKSRQSRNPLVGAR